jgi:hypothetical protein
MISKQILYSAYNIFLEVIKDCYCFLRGVCFLGNRKKLVPSSLPFASLHTGDRKKLVHSSLPFASLHTGESVDLLTQHASIVRAPNLEKSSLLFGVFRHLVVKKYVLEILQVFLP